MRDAYEIMCNRYERLSKKDERKQKKNKRCFLWLRHEIIYIKGFGYRCKHCGKPPSELKGELSTNEKI